MSCFGSGNLGLVPSHHPLFAAYSFQCPGHLRRGPCETGGSVLTLSPHVLLIGRPASATLQLPLAQYLVSSISAAHFCLRLSPHQPNGQNWSCLFHSTWLAPPKGKKQNYCIHTLDTSIKLLTVHMYIWCTLFSVEHYIV